MSLIGVLQLAVLALGSSGDSILLLGIFGRHGSILGTALGLSEGDTELIFTSGVGVVVGWSGAVVCDDSWGELCNLLVVVSS